MPLYLEWAPLGTVDKSKAGNKAGAKASSRSSSSSSSSSSSVGGSSSGGSGGSAAKDDEGDDYSTLFLKNLSFSTGDEALRAHILKTLGGGTGTGSGGDLRTVTITKKQKGEHWLSMGFGFAEFRTAAAATAALKCLQVIIIHVAPQCPPPKHMPLFAVPSHPILGSHLLHQGSVLDGHSLEVKPSEKRISKGAARGPGASGAAGAAGAAAPKAAKAGAGSNKLIVRNLAFQVRCMSSPPSLVVRHQLSRRDLRSHPLVSVRPPSFVCPSAGVAGGERRAQGVVFRLWRRETCPHPQENGRRAPRIRVCGFFDRPGTALSKPSSRPFSGSLSRPRLVYNLPDYLV